MFSQRRLFALAVLLVAAMCVAVGMATAQGGGPEERAPAADMSIEAALGTAFLYQGRLMDNGHPASGTYDFRFILYNAESGGSQVGRTLYRRDVRVRDGLFTVNLDFGANPFQGEARWLEVGVRPGTSTGAYTVLSPRQPIYAVPYALSLRPGATVQDANTSVQFNKRAGIAWPTQLVWTFGVYATAEGSAMNTAYYGVYGKGSTAGVRGESDQAAGYGGFFTNSAAGGVGLLARSGDDGSPDIVLGANSNTNDNGVIASDPSKNSSDIVIKTNDTVRIDLDNDRSGEDADFEIRDKDDRLIFDVDDSGAIYSRTDTKFVASPLNMKASPGDVSQVYFAASDAGSISIYPNDTGPATVYLPVGVPSYLFGQQVKLRSVRVCYKCNNVNSYIDDTQVRQINETGTYTTLLHGVTNRNSTSWRCYTISSPDPQPIRGALFVRFLLSFGGTGSHHQIYIGTVTLTLTE